MLYSCEVPERVTMLKEVFLLWLEYLRSGNYKHAAYGKLTYLNRFSVMGVLADLLIKEYSEGRWEETQHNGIAYVYRPYEDKKDPVTGAITKVLAEDKLKSFVYLPSEMWYWPSLTRRTQEIIYNWSDIDRLSHMQIADKLEAGLHTVDHTDS